MSLIFTPFRIALVACGLAVGLFSCALYAELPWSDKSQHKRLKVAHSELKVDYGVCADQRAALTKKVNELVKNSDDWSKAYKAQGIRLTKQSSKAQAAISARAKRQNANSYEAGYLACKAKGTVNGTQGSSGPVGRGDDDAGNVDSSGGLRSFWKRHAYRGSETTN